MSYEGMKSSLGRRAEVARIDGFHPHRLRHTMAVDWLRGGGTVSGLMSQAGWVSIEMVQKYIEAAAAELAVDESHRLNLGDF
jgi:integrase